MNIKDAKEQIKNAMLSYFTKNEFGEYVIPTSKQRPIFMMGPPGIGKTAIMEQIASELNVGLVSYSMTHHTRQSALGLPFIVKKNYGGKEFEVSEYTMSEIIASVYDMIEKTGIKEGILFLDEINCVSETLAPSMLQFLQYKIFGKHSVPNGWIVVTAGNPPEYNNSVREFDIVTWDRLKRIDVEPDYKAWKEYAVNSGVHASITTYLDIKTADFYSIETTVDGKSFVTVRGWSDLSEMIKLYEKNNIEVNYKLVSQYLQNEKIAKSFSNYYSLFNKYKSDYQVDSILNGKVDKVIKERAKEAKFDEKISLIGIILDKLFYEFKNIYFDEESIKLLSSSIKNLKSKSEKNLLEKCLDDEIENYNKKLETGRTASTLSNDMQFIFSKTIFNLEKMKPELTINNEKDSQKSFEFIKKLFDNIYKNYKKLVKETSEKLKNGFNFCEEIFGSDQEMLLFITELTANKFSSLFISHYGSEEYYKFNKSLLFEERQIHLIRQIENLNLNLDE